MRANGVSEWIKIRSRRDGKGIGKNLLWGEQRKKSQGVNIRRKVGLKRVGRCGSRGGCGAYYFLLLVGKKEGIETKGIGVTKRRKKNNDQEKASESASTC